MGQDYQKILDLQLDKKSSVELETSILKSKFINLSVYSNEGILESKLLIMENKKGLWYQTKNGYNFYGMTNNRRDIVTVLFDTLTMKAKFEYGAD